LLHIRSSISGAAPTLELHNWCSTYGAPKISEIAPDKELLSWRCSGYGAPYPEQKLKIMELHMWSTGYGAPNVELLRIWSS